MWTLLEHRVDVEDEVKAPRRALLPLPRQLVFFDLTTEATRASGALVNARGHYLRTGRPRR